MNKPGCAMKKCTKAFTIIELLAVIVISAVLITIVLPRLLTSAEEAKYKACRIQVATINQQVELYHALTGQWPRADLMDMVWDTDTYPGGMPSCPVTGYFYWLYEDTRRVGGHNEDNPESHEQLGYMTIGDMNVDSQDFLVGWLERYYDAESNQYLFKRYDDYEYLYIDGKKTKHPTAYKCYTYNAWGSLMYEYNVYINYADEPAWNPYWRNPETGQVEGRFEYQETGRKLNSRLRDGTLQLTREHTFDYVDTGTALKKIYAQTDTAWYYSSGETKEHIKSYSTCVNHFDGATAIGKTVTGYGVDTSGNRGAEIGKTVYSYGEDAVTRTVWQDGTKLQVIVRTTDNRDSSNRVTAYTDVYFDGQGNKMGAYKFDCEGWDDKGFIVNRTETWLDSNGDVLAGRNRKRVVDPEVSGRTNATFTHYDAGGNLTSTLNWSMQYDSETGAQTSYKVVTRDAQNIITGISEQSNYAYDDKNRIVGYDKVFKNPDGSTAKTSTYSDIVFDFAGRTTGWSSESTKSADGSQETRVYNVLAFGGVQGRGYNNTTSEEVITYNGVGGGRTFAEHTVRSNIQKDVTGYTAYDWEKKDESGNVIESGHFPDDTP